MYCSIESQRMWWYRSNQHVLRAELYSGIADAVQQGDTDGSAIGRRVILPSSFTGGPRHMYQLYMDSMALVRHFTKPSLFITFTCNPEWQEITDALEEGQTSNDRPDLVARAFHVRLKALLEDITKKQVSVGCPPFGT
jgi:hypothetical protein